MSFNDKEEEEKSNGKGRKYKQSKEELTLLFIQLVNKGENTVEIKY